MRVSRKGARRALLVGLLTIWAAMECLPPPALAQGRIIRPMMRSIADQRRINQASRVSLAVVRPRLDIVQDKMAGTVAGLSLSSDRSLLLVVLEDGSARFWHLTKGVQLGGVVGENVTEGVALGGQAAEAVMVRSSGAWMKVRPDGTTSLLHKGSGASDPRPVLSADGSAVAYRDHNGGWAILRDGRVHGLDEAGGPFRPTLSRDGKRVVYGSAGGGLYANDLPGEGSRAGAGVGPCVEGGTVTVGVFAPDGERVFLGDEQGNVCGWRPFPPGEGAAGPLDRRPGHTGPVRTITVDPDGSHVATRGEDGIVRVWSMPSFTPVASFELESDVSRPLLLDASRGWVFVGERNGTVAVYSYSGSAASRAANLISTNDGGWAVVDREGRFDGPQNGVDAMVWAGETDAQTLPVDAFSEGYFEPGLLAKLDDAAPRFLNDQPRDLSEDGYIQPPSVAIDAIDGQAVNDQGDSRVRVRLEDPDYPRESVSEVRLYHNGKLVPPERMTVDAAEPFFDYEVQLLPGQNDFAAVAVGPEGVQGNAATATFTVPAQQPSRPRLEVVSIGINAYWVDGDLFYGRNDAKTVVSTLRDRGASLFREVGAVTLLDSSASATAIRYHLSRRFPEPQDVLVVFFAGHGYALKEKEGWEWYLMPFSRVWQRRKLLPEDISRYGIPSRELMRSLTSIPAKKIFLILDSCRSGAVVEAMEGRAFDDAVGRKALRRIARVGGIHVLAASRADEDGTELLTIPHGALTFLLLEGMRGKADVNRDQQVTVQEIVGYATREMPLLSQRLVSETISQMPVAYSRGVDFALARDPADSATAVPPESRAATQGL